VLVVPAPRPPRAKH